MAEEAAKAGGENKNEEESVKLFVGQVPRSMTEEQLLYMFREVALVDEATIIRDKATRASRGCCFLVCPSMEEADKAVAAYHNKCTLPGAYSPMQVKYAYGEQERLEHKLFVGMLPKGVAEDEVSALFSKYGNIRDLQILRGPQQTSKGCAFLKFESKEQALAAIEALNGKHVMEGSNVTLVVKWADTEKERQVRTAQKAQSLASNLSKIDSVHQPSVFGASPMQYVPPYNGLDYQTEAFCTTMDSELKDIIKVTNGKLEMLVKELERVVKFLENQLPLNDPKPSYQHSPFSVEYDEKRHKYNESNSNKLEPPGQYGHIQYPLQNQAAYNNMFPHVNQGNALCGLNPNVSLRTVPKTLNPMQSAGYICSPYPALPGLQYPVSYPGSVRPLGVSHGSVKLSNMNSDHTASPGSSTSSASQIEGPPGANLFIYHIPQEYGDKELANAFQGFGRVLSAKVFVDKATGVSKCFGFVSYDSPAAAQAAINRMNGSQLGGKKLKVQLKRENKNCKTY